MALALAGCGTPAGGPTGPATLGPVGPATLGSAPSMAPPAAPAAATADPAPVAGIGAPAPASRLRCGSLEATVRPVGDAMRLRAAGRTVELRPVPSASGARYQSDTDPGTWLWSRGDRAMLSVLGRQYPECTVTAEGAPPPFVARGHEPDWELVLAGTRLRFTTDLGRTRLEADASPAVAIDGGHRHEATAGGEILRVTVLDTLCTDTMSAMPYPAGVSVTRGPRRWNGCGGEPASLLRGAEWVVEDIDAAGIVDRSRMTVGFGPDGRLEGHAGCNRYAGRWALSGEGLRLSAAPASARTCAPALMHQEARFLARLREVHRFGIDADGALRLRAPGRPGILARRG